MIKLQRTTILQAKDGQIVIKVNSRPGDAGIVINSTALDNWCARQVRERLFDKPPAKT